MTEPGVLQKALRLPRYMSFLLWGLTAAGAAAFIVGALGVSPLRAWTIFLVNLLFFSGMAQGGLVFSATLHLTEARWGKPLERLSQAGAFFLPVSLILFILLFLGSEHLFPWLREPIPAREPWLNLPFLFYRNVLGLLALVALSLFFLYYSLRPDFGSLKEKGVPEGGALARLLTSGWRGMDKERARAQRIKGILSPLILILFAVVFSLIAFDLIMALDPHWYSTLFGGYYFIGSYYIGLAALAITAISAGRCLGVEKLAAQPLLHNLGKLIFGFCFFWMSLVWSQFIVIWYGNLPEETGFVILRIYDDGWRGVSWTAFGLSFFIPFIILLSRKAKSRQRPLFVLSGVILVGMWLERYILVVPSLWKGEGVPFGILEALVTAGFISGTGLCYIAFLRAFPLLPLSEGAIVEKNPEAEVHPSLQGEAPDPSPSP